MEALFYEQLKDGTVQCTLCQQRCKIRPGKRGLCSVRENMSGILETLVYDRVIARHVDPIEKKPLFHFLPGSMSYSIGTVGCNFRCRFCQNADIAQMATDNGGRIMGQKYPPEQIVEEAVQSGCRSLAFTYTEPTVFFELAFDTAKVAHEQGIKNIFVTNGYMTPEVLDMIGPYLDAANVDLKSFSDDFYRKQCGARLEPVLESLKKFKQVGTFLEVTTLVIPGLNDDPAELRDLAGFIVNELGDETPWHVSRFHPTYKLLDRPATPVQTLIQARNIGIDAGLKYVYTGNIPGEGTEDTTCYGCGQTLIRRRGFAISENRIENGRCSNCGALIHGVELS